MSDDELFYRWRARDDLAGREFVARTHSIVRRFFLSKLGRIDDVDDLVQQTFAVFLAKRDKFEGRSRATTFLLGIAYNHLRAHYRSRCKEFDPLRFSVVDFTAIGPMTRVAKGEELQLLLGALVQLPLELQAVVELYYVEELRGKEIAQILDVPEGTARSRLRLAKGRLRTALQDMGAPTSMMTDLNKHFDTWAREIRLWMNES